MDMASDKYIYDGVVGSGGPLTSPLLQTYDTVGKNEDEVESVTSADYSEDEDESLFEEEEPPMSLMGMMKASVVFIAAVACLSASVSAILSIPATIVYVAGSLGVAVPPLVCYRETHIVKIPGTRKIINWLRNEAIRLRGENDRLSQEIDKLEICCKKAQEAEKKLISITKEQGVNANMMVDLVKENGALLKQMRNSQKALALQDITRLVMSADRDKTFSIDDEELKELTQRMYQQLLVHGVHLNQAVFSHVIRKSNRSLEAVINICTEYMSGDRTEKEVTPTESGDFKFTEGESEMFAYESRPSRRKSISEDSLRALLQNISFGSDISRSSCDV